MRSAPLALALVAACAPTGPGGGGGDDDTGTADVTIEREGEDPLRLVHDPEQSQLSLTPPAEGTVELTFAFQDPAVELRLVVDGNQAAQGDVVELPSPAVELTVDVDGTTFGAGAGSVELSVLDVEVGALEAILDAVLEDDDGATLQVSGDVAASS